MRKLLLGTVVLLGLFMGVASTALVIAQNVLSRPLVLAPIFRTAEGNPCPMPCLFGVRPGVTTFADALQLLQMHPSLKKAMTDFSYTPYRAQFTDHGTGIQVLLFGIDSGLVESVQMQVELRLPHSFRPTLGEVLTHFGAPENSTFILPDTVATVYYNHVVISVNPVEARLSLNSEVSWIGVFAGESKKPSLTQWRGFSSFVRYNAASLMR